MSFTPNESFWHVPEMEEWRLRSLWNRGFAYRGTYFAIAARLQLNLETVFCEELNIEAFNALAEEANTGTEGGYLTWEEILENELPLSYAGDQLYSKDLLDWRADTAIIDTVQLYSVELGALLISKMYAIALAYTLEKCSTFNQKGGEL